MATSGVRPVLAPMASSNIANTLRRSLLIKVISKLTPSKEDVASVIELTAAKVVEAIQAQSMTFYLIEGGEISFKQVYYSPGLEPLATRRAAPHRDGQIIAVGDRKPGFQLRPGRTLHRRRSPPIFQTLLRHR